MIPRLLLLLQAYLFLLFLFYNFSCLFYVFIFVTFYVLNEKIKRFYYRSFWTFLYRKKRQYKCTSKQQFDDILLCFALLCAAAVAAQPAANYQCMFIRQRVGREWNMADRKRHSLRLRRGVDVIDSH